MSKLIEKVGQSETHLSKFFFVHIRILGRQGGPNLDIMSKILQVYFVCFLMIALGQCGYYCQAQPKLQQSWVEFALFPVDPAPHPTTHPARIVDFGNRVSTMDYSSQLEHKLVRNWLEPQLVQNFCSNSFLQSLIYVSLCSLVTKIIDIFGLVNNIIQFQGPP